MTHKEALMLALEWADDRISLTKWQKARAAIKEALAQPEYQSTADKSQLEKVPAKGTLLAQPELCKYGQEPKSCTSSPMDCQCALDATFEQPEQEPVAKNEEGRITWLVDDWPQNCFLYAEPPKWTPVEIGVDVTSEGAHVVAMYLLPDAVRYVFYSQFHTAPQRTWVGLTEDERTAIRESAAQYHDVTGWGYAKAVQQATELKLQEKNA